MVAVDVAITHRVRDVVILMIARNPRKDPRVRNLCSRPPAATVTPEIRSRRGIEAVIEVIG